VGLYEPLRNPTAIFTSEEAEFLYVADAGNQRIVQLSKEGRFLRQFKAGRGEELDQLKGLFASETYHRLYFVSGNKLYVTNIPSE
jgi:DNA-binding beta-propeller fold protein YncE